ncbi:N-acetylglucosaminidase [Virgibacillus dokdonensis]|uniref:N-acetylglucosaminidase n=1 Tax=Virgibacillus dokdonensis TaxID=302167 RepID=UPI0020C9854B|nr:N-acetylglucosaminidase [Virgibacillus dokdonensis]
MRKFFIFILVLVIINFGFPYQNFADEQVNLNPKKESKEEMGKEIKSQEEVDEKEMEKEVKSQEEVDEEEMGKEIKSQEEVDEEEMEKEVKSQEEVDEEEMEKEVESQEEVDEEEMEKEVESQEEVNKEEIENDIKQNYINNQHQLKYTKIEASKLGRIQSSEAKIYKTIGNEGSSIKAGSKYTDKIFYIKKKAQINGEDYYLISTVASATKGVIGWVNAKDMWSQSHKAVDHEKKTFYLKGSGWAYTDAWGAGKDVIYNDLTPYRNKEFQVNLTEKVGDAIWYRGYLDGKKVWIQAYNVISPVKSAISKLGRIQSSEAKIYKTIGNEGSSIKAGSKYTDKIFYIKKKAQINGEDYYLISTVASATKGAIGWVNAKDMWSQSHKAVDHEKKTFYLKGSGWAYTDAWGAGKDVIYNDLTPYRNKEFQVNLTEKVGDAIWYRGYLDGKKVWIQAYNVAPFNNYYSKYNLTLDKMLDIQMNVNPKTDKSYKLWIREDAFSSISNGKGVVEGNWNLRRGPGTIYQIGGKVKDGTSYKLYSSSKGADGFTWYYVKDTTGWVTADKNDVRYYLNPSNFIKDPRHKYQFLSLSRSANLNESEVNDKVLKGKGVLENKAQFFLDGAKLYGINEVYLIAHALLETGNGTSELARGVTHNGKTVYNMYGIGAKDSCPVECGKRYAYEAGWFTPELAIKGGAQFVGKEYIDIGQDTLYKMRWNPIFAEKNGYASHQYATDIGWAYKQTYRMYSIYGLLNQYTLNFDIPIYK